MTYIDTESEGGQSGSHSRTGDKATADRQSGRYRRRIRIGIGAVGAALAIVAATPQVIYRNDNYAENLQMIQAQSIRNTNHDNSAFRDLEQDKLPTATGGGLVDLDRAAYLTASPNTEQAFPVVDGGQNRTGCEFSHFAYDDPIVFPRQPGKSHLHMFYGNTDTNAYSTYDTLIDSGSGTCNGQELNRTGYWAPAMIDPDPTAPGGAWVRIPERVVVYYKGEGLANGERFPVGGGANAYKPKMAMIANFSTEAGQFVSAPEYPGFDGGAPGEVNFKCTSNFSGFQHLDGINDIPNCDGNYFINTFGAPYPETRTVMEVELKMWNCLPTGATGENWNDWSPAGPTRGGWFFSNCNGRGGQGTGTLDDKDIYPNLSTFINYVIEPGENSSDWYLASDVNPTTYAIGQRGATLHSDWWGGWHPTINQEWLDNCVNFKNGGTASGCGFGFLSDNGPDNTAPLPGRALKYRPQYDTLGNSGSYKIGIADLFTELCIPLNPGRVLTTPASGAVCVP